MEVYRFKNWKDYILKKNELDKKNDTVALVVCYNQIESIKKLAEFFSHQKNLDFLFIDNCSTDRTFNFLLKNYKDKFNLIRTIKNLGGSGGFSLAQEWAIERGYEYCLFIEDDILPLDEDIIEELLKHKALNVQVVAKYYEFDTPSVIFHFQLLPVWVFKKAGVVNKDFFIRADDWEYLNRINKILVREKLTLKPIIINKYFSHPVIKKGFEMWTNYFSLRNWLISYIRYPRTNFVFDILITLIKHFWNALFILFFDKKKEAIFQVKDAIVHVFNNDFSKNELIMKKYKNFKLEPKKYELKELPLEEFIKKFKKYRLIGRLAETRLRNKFGNSFSNFILGKYNNPARVFAFFGEKIVFIEEIDFISNKVLFFEYHNHRLISFPLISFSFLLSLVFSLFFSLLIILKFNISKQRL